MTEENGLSPQDHLAVVHLVGAYAQHFDLGDREAFLSLFTADAVVQLTSGTHHEGIEAISRWFDGLLANQKIGAGAPSRHLMGIPVVRASEAGCSSHTYIAHFGLDAEGRVKPTVNSATDQWVKVDGRWLMRRRVLARDLG